MQTTLPPELPRLMFISHDHHLLSHEEQAELVCAAGIRLIQLRMKNQPFETWKLTAEKVLAITKRYGARLIINDNLAVARETGADGVHLGKQDMEPAKARELAGSGFIIGSTANTFEDIMRVRHDQVNYIGLGPFRYTETKINLEPVLGESGIADIIKKCRDAGVHLPVYAIGGIRLEDIANLAATGVYGVAVSGAILSAADPATAAAELVKEMNLMETA